ncbi:MAG: hypothetical protein M1831_003985 [Alyxoria varia]|nr:MAG: hypothetical protein M1831_003985 [Alyxoria varia]
MADPSRTAQRLLTRESVHGAHERIKPFIHHTPVLTSSTLSTIASTPRSASSQSKGACEPSSNGHGPSPTPAPANPNISLFFKCENLQKVGAFKVRGAFHALSRLTNAELGQGVITHSSGNHAQALALAAKTRGVPAHIVMPTISTPSKIAATEGYGAKVYFSGSTAPEREEKVREVREAMGGPVLVPPYDHPDIILGQGTVGLEFEAQVKEMTAGDSAAVGGVGNRTSEGLDAVIVPCGGGGHLSGVATALYGTGISVFGAEPSYSGADDCRRGLRSDPPTRVESVRSLTIADGLRTPVGHLPWSVISDKSKVRDVFSVSEDDIKKAMRLLLERMKIVVEPSAAVGLAVVLYCEEFRRLVDIEIGPDGRSWNVGVVLSGGNTTVEAIGELYRDERRSEMDGEKSGKREEGVVGMDGEKVAENVAG